MIYDGVQEILINELLGSSLVDEVQPSYKSSEINDRVRETKVIDDRRRILQAFKPQNEVRFYRCMFS